MRSIKRVTEQRDIQAVAELAYEIWNEYFVDMIGQAQVNYMLSHFQSVPAITAQLESGQEYYLLKLDAKPVGYLSLVSDSPGDKLMISKIYVKQTIRGSGLGNYLLDFVKDQCQKRDIHSIWLTVNRNNQSTIDWYLSRGFKVTDEIKKDIGAGYFMDDLVMEMASV
jgi:ribosomal protein S18 acetylase RimI-like enzyme